MKAWLMDTENMHSYQAEFGEFIGSTLDTKLKNFEQALGVWIQRNNNVLTAWEKSAFLWIFQPVLRKLFLVDRTKNDNVSKFLKTMQEANSVDQKLEIINNHVKEIKLPGDLQIFVNDILAYQKDYSRFKIK